ncbi:toxin YoeB [Campylobacterota bacterium]|nr:toxin YoeB [Campylobacterota bacterium]
MNLVWSPNAWEDYIYWQENDRKILKKLNAIIKDIQRSPFDGIGKPEPLRHALAGHYSRRITDEHRIVYTADNENIYIVQCRFHYEG